MIRIALLFVSALLASYSGGFSTPALARATNMTRAEIRSMPIEARPSRPGHFYGNTVRRRHGR
ncbi:MAG: hypothetical protein AB7O62_09020 [Pirellulales bacterium]